MKKKTCQDIVNAMRAKAHSGWYTREQARQAEIDADRKKLEAIKKYPTAAEQDASLKRLEEWSEAQGDTCHVEQLKKCRNDLKENGL